LQKVKIASEGHEVRERKEKGEKEKGNMENIKDPKLKVFYQQFNKV